MQIVLLRNAIITFSSESRSASNNEIKPILSK